jgi:hypothetical protein
VIGTKNIGGTVDQKDVVAFRGGFDGNGLGEGLFGGFRHGRNLRIFAAIDSLWSAFFWCYSPAIHVKPGDEGWARGDDRDTSIFRRFRFPLGRKML